MVAQDSVPLNGANTNREEGVNVFRCESCTHEPFSTKVGLSQHIRQAHPVLYNQGINVNRVNRRWTDEEVDRMARAEATAVRGGEVANMNIHLQGLFNNRTLEAIKGKRRPQSYKDKVAFLVASEDLAAQIEENNNALVNQANNDNDQNIASTIDDDFLKDHILSLATNLEGNTLKSTKDLVMYARMLAAGTSLERGTLAKWLKSIFKHAKPPNGLIYKDPVVKANISKTQKRRQEYAVIQKLYKKDFGGAVRRVLSGGKEEVNMPPQEEVVDFWKHIFEQEPEEIGAEANIAYEENAQLRGVWAPITVDDILDCELDLDSAAGPDGITVANWRGINVQVRALFFNMVLYTGSLDEELKSVRTVLIPKGTGNVEAGNTRPLSISSVVVRQLHKILAKRFKSLHSFDSSQRAFIDCDGTLENLSILSTVLADARMSKKEVHIATLDLRKAFDSVSHKAIIDTITELGFPRKFIGYVKQLYTDAKTTLQYNSTNTILKVKQGVLQGDPISPLLFNAVLDRAIKQIPEAVGYRLNGIKISCVAYADDLILVAMTKEGLQTSIDAVTLELASFGLKINTEKSSTLSLVPSGREKKIKVIEEPQFAIDGTHLRAIGVLDTWKYLGIHFTGSKINERETCLASDLDKITKAPLKPYQRLRILCGAVIPKYLHTLVLGRISSVKLKNMDLLIRSYVKRWLYFPKDLPSAYLYAKVRDGGLGIFNLSLQIPLIKRTRLQRFLNNEGQTVQAIKQSQHIRRQLEWCNKQLDHIGANVTKDSLALHWRNVLYNMVDTNDLKDARSDTASNSWVVDQAHKISGADYIHYHHIRAGCLPSKARLARGREVTRLCRAGCMVSETNYHIIQQCQRTHGGRCLRHDRVVELLYSNLNGRDNVKVIKEPRFKTEVGLRKPDLLITENGKTIVLDVQVVSGRDMKRDYLQKCNKYREVRGLETLIKRKCISNTVEFQSLTISFKGVIEESSSKLLYKLGINEHLKFLIVTSILRGTWLNWNTFNKITTMAR